MDLEPVLYALAGSLGLSMIIASIGATVWMIRNRGETHHGARREGKPSATPLVNPQVAQALEVYRELAKDKLEVIKTALTMGYKDEEIARLDARLEAMIGKDKVEALLKGGSPEALASADLLDTQLESEMRRLKQVQDAK